MPRFLRIILLSAIMVVVPFVYAGTALTEPIPVTGGTTLQSDATVVFIHSRECPICARVSPIVSEIRKQYKDKIVFADLDVTDRKDMVRSRRLASTFKVSSCYALNKDSFPFRVLMRC